MQALQYRAYEPIVSSMPQVYRAQVRLSTGASGEWSEPVDPAREPQEAHQRARAAAECSQDRDRSHRQA
eukprot:14499739-Alexandrium_andersonii.AAC.1